MEQRRHIMDRVLKRAQDFGLLFCFLALLLVETAYVAWLERLPAFAAPEQPAPFITLPPGYGRPRVEVTMLLTVLGGALAWSALSLVAFPKASAERPQPSALTGVPLSIGLRRRHSGRRCQARIWSQFN